LPAFEIGSSTLDTWHGEAELNKIAVRKNSLSVLNFALKNNAA
jgi:hypothetical protein